MMQRYEPHDASASSSRELSIDDEPHTASPEEQSAPHPEAPARERREEPTQPAAALASDNPEDDPLLLDAEQLPEMVRDGIAIARSAARLQLKNHILIDTLANGQQYDPERYRQAASRIITELANESDGELHYLEQMIKRAKGLGFKSTGMHDYRRGDLENLKTRKHTAQQVGEQLRHRAQSEIVVNALIHDAQQSAWREVARNIEHNLETELARVPDDGESAEQRAARINEIIKQDLPKLERERKRSERQQQRAQRSTEARGGNVIARMLAALRSVFHRHTPR